MSAARPSSDPSHQDGAPLPDAALVWQTQSGHPEAFATLLQRYEARLQWWTRNYFLSGGDRADVDQVARIAFWQAVQQYRVQDPAAQAFAVWVQVAVVRDLQDAVHTLRRRKRHATERLLSLDAARKMAGTHGAAENIAVLLDTVAAPDLSPEAVWIAQETVQDFWQALPTVLSSREWQVWQMWWQTQSIAETAHRVGLSYKFVDNALQRIRRKARALWQFLSEGSSSTQSVPQMARRFRRRPR